MIFETCAFGHQLEGKNIAVEVLHVLGERFSQGIRSGLAILFSESSSNPGVHGQGELMAGHELEFFWEFWPQPEVKKSLK